MCDVLVVGSQQDTSLLFAIDARLRQSGIVVEAAEISVSRSDPARQGAPKVVAIVPKDGDPERQAILRLLKDTASHGTHVVAVARADDYFQARPLSLAAIVRMGDDPHYLQSRLLESVLDHSPFRCIAIPGITAPSGVAAWTSTQIIASCDDSGRVVAIDLSSGRAITLITGLVEPHGVSLDRRTLLVAAKGSHSVFCGELLDGRLAPAREIGSHGSPVLRSPHFAFQLGGDVIIVDTDHDRVLRAHGHVLGKLSRFEKIEVDSPLRNPCGATIVQGAVVIADTFNDRLVVVRDGQTIPTVDLCFPAPVQVALAPNGVLAVVSDDGLHLLDIEIGTEKVEARRCAHFRAGGEHPLRTPFGVTIDRAGRLYVADRGRGVVWSAEMAEMLEGVRRAA